MSKCAVFNCNNKRKNGVTLFRMPLEPPEISKSWINFLILCGTNVDNLPLDIYICEGHFNTDCIIHNKQRSILKRHAIPTITCFDLNESKDISTVISLNF